MNLKEFCDNVGQWAKERGLVSGSSVKDQFLKLIEEYGEMALAIADFDEDDSADGYGDMIVVLAVMSEIAGTRLDEIVIEFENMGYDSPVLAVSLGKLARSIAKNDGMFRRYVHDVFVAIELDCQFKLRDSDVYGCMERAWKEIAQRKGRLINGVFVKESDLPQ